MNPDEMVGDDIGDSAGIDDAEWEGPGAEKAWVLGALLALGLISCVAKSISWPAGILSNKN